MRATTSSCISNISATGRSYFSAHKWLPLAASISCTVTRNLSPTRRTLPSST
jgi:hypothetical protein